MGQFGDKLRRERELRGITLDEVAIATKIGTRNLRALEEEKFSQLPGGIFNKGFVKAYARYVGIDEEQAVGDYMVANQALAASGEVNIAVVARQFEASRDAGYGGRKHSAATLVWSLGGCFCPRKRLRWRVALSPEMVGAPGGSAETDSAASQYDHFSDFASAAGAGRLESASASVLARQTPPKP